MKEGKSPEKSVKAIKAGPIIPSERIQSLDVLRGFALLGILVMNIQSFSMIEAAYMNPAAFGDLTGLNKWVWIVSHTLTDSKFMALFSILFGAGIILFTGKRESKGLKSGGLHYRRTFWLLLIGLVHAYLLWYGDILVVYALCALLIFLYRKLSPKVLLILGFCSIAVPSILFFLFGSSISLWPPEAQQNMLMGWKPAAEIIQAEIAAYRGGWLDQMAHRIPASLKFHTFIFFIYIGWRAGGLMLVGMALHKWKVLTAKLSKRVYQTMLIIGFGIGIPVIGYGIVRNFAADWSLEYSMFFGPQFNYWGSLFITSGFIGLIMLICQSRGFARMKTRLAAMGRMAFTNYLMQTLICITLFYGHGFGLFGKVERWEQVLIVIVIWTGQLIVSPIWLKHFRFGPVEWLWRSLTYWRLQPMRLKS